MKSFRYALSLLLLVAPAACEKRLIPKPDPGWFPIGGSAHILASLDTTSITPDGSWRLVRVRMDSVRFDEDDVPFVVPSWRRESVHRVSCGTLVVQDVETALPRGVPAPGAAAVRDSGIAFAQHPLGDRLFPTVCSAIGRVATIRAEEKSK